MADSDDYVVFLERNHYEMVAVIGKGSNDIKHNAYGTLNPKI